MRRGNMNNNGSKGARGIASALGAMIAAVALALTGSTAAYAAPPTHSDVIITKTSQTGTLSGAADGLPVADSQLGSPIAGVTFTASRVTAVGGKNLDLNTNEGQLLAASATPADVDEELAPTATGTTDAAGLIEWTLPRGMYLVKETVTPPGVTPAGDFLLAVPLTNPSDSSAWLDTIYVYPKNSQVKMTKVGDTSSVTAVGDNITWTIEADAPRVQTPEGTAFQPVTYFRIDDTLAAQLTHVATEVAINGAVLDAADFQLNGADTGDLKLMLTAAGLAKLNTANASGAQAAKVTWTLTTQVGASALGATITNQASLTALTAATPGPVDPVDPEIDLPDPEKPPVTDPETGGTVVFGAQTFTKKSNLENNKVLAGAEFKVYSSLAAAEAAGIDNLKPIAGTSVDGVWTSKADGIVTVDGLRRSDNIDGKIVTDQALFTTYYLVETKAPAGHQLLAEPIPFQVLDGAAAIDVINVSTTSPGFTLPLTGGAGTALFAVVGSLLLGGVLLLVRKRRKALATEHAA